jgi:phosphopantetheinyl transferase
MSQTTVRSTSHCKEILPIDLTTVGVLHAVKQLNDHGFLIVLAQIARLPPDLPEATTLEKQLAESQGDERRQQGFLARRRIARSILAQRIGTHPRAVSITRGPQGEPQVASPKGSFHLSFSAREDIALIGIATSRIGVDIEIIRPGMLIPVNVLRADERAVLEALPEHARCPAFAALWTAKEAVVKALHCGFQMPPEAIRIDGWSAGEPLALRELASCPEGIESSPGSWHLKTWPNLVVAGLTGGLVVGAACIAQDSASREPAI